LIVAAVLKKCGGYVSVTNACGCILLAQSQ